MKKYIILIALLLSSCTTNRFLYNNEKGLPVYEANCSLGTYGDCLQKAGQQCPAGFNILMSSEQQTGVYTDAQGKASSNTRSSASAFTHNNWINAFGNSSTTGSFGSQSFATNTYTRYMIYTCR